MSLGTPIPVRFSEAADQRLSEVARRSGLSKAELIRLATDEFLEKVARRGIIEQRIVLAEEMGPAPAGPVPAPAPVAYRRPKGKKKE